MRRVRYWSYGAVVTASVALVLLPGAPLLPILVLRQAPNAILLLPLLILMARMSQDTALMGEHRSTRAGAIAQAATIAVLAVCVGALALLTLDP